jgi:hypothetical protein
MLREDYDPGHEPEWLRHEPESERRKFWGPNAIPMVIQFAAGVAIVYFLVWIGFARFFYNLSCTYITGSCL